jgi:hypothetical protein
MVARPTSAKKIRRVWRGRKYFNGKDQTMTDRQIKRVAAAAARRLFTAGTKERAERLRLYGPAERFFGGWSEKPVADQIADVLTGHFKRQAKRRKK